ncbi:MAG: hypothetical protein HWN66_01475 [Candidatus Helarchaeota archaeon]|nr:hypothetical protein [Candidatus Helarchaeota archaeon]
MTLVLILFSAGLVCVVSAILLAIYLLRSDKFTTSPKEEAKIPPYPSFKELDEESRLSRLKSKIGSFFRSIKSVFKRSKDEIELPEDEPLKSTADIPSELPEEESNSIDEDSNSEI